MLDVVLRTDSNNILLAFYGNFLHFPEKDDGSEKLANLSKVVNPVSGVGLIPKPMLLTSITCLFSIKMEEPFYYFLN